MVLSRTGQQRMESALLYYSRDPTVSDVARSTAVQCEMQTMGGSDAAMPGDGPPKRKGL